MLIAAYDSVRDNIPIFHLTVLLSFAIDLFNFLILL